ncbi:MAG: hypothetical protein LBN39_05485 [Planctomycetaceae bacterium]|nr:hypothetical protein [Planctomycetaceae bacterium]
MGLVIGEVPATGKNLTNRFWIATGAVKKIQEKAGGTLTVDIEDYEE